MLTTMWRFVIAELARPELRYRSLKGNPRLFGDPAPSVKEKTLYGQPESAAKAAAAGGGAAIAFNYDNPPQQVGSLSKIFSPS